MRKAWLVVTLAAMTLAACAVDGLFFGAVTSQDHARMPPPAPQTIAGVTVAGADVTIVGSDGHALDKLLGTADAQGAFHIDVDGGTSLQSAAIQARVGRKQYLALLPQLPAQPSVLAPARTFDVRDLSPGAAQVDAKSTTLAVLIAGKLRSQGMTLSAASPDALAKTLIALDKDLLAGKPEVLAVAQRVACVLLAADSTVSATTPPELPFDISGAGPTLRQAFLDQNSKAATCDGIGAISVASFQQALDDASATFAFDACFASDKIQVVLMTALKQGAKDGNCQALDPYLWATNVPGKVVFLTGGIHKDTRVCSKGAAPPCLSDADVDAATQALGNWVPNKVPMYDDGTHGDSVAGDGIWSIALALPYSQVKGSDPGVRLAYKFTYGSPGQGWTDSEEWPGNQRLLELVDVNGDHRVSRFDWFADETSNKDKKNGLTPDRGGCGSLTWPSDVVLGSDGKPTTCVQTDVRERPVDLTGDCVVDGWPPVGGVAPLTIPCPDK
jgi:hypothetical protein